MAPILTFLFVALSFHTIVDATEVTFVKDVDNKIYVETDSEHYAMFGQYKNKHGPVIIAVYGEHTYQLKANCEKEYHPLDEVSKDLLDNYARLRGIYLKDKSMAWSNTFSSDKREFSVVKFKDSTVIYSSKFFPSKIAKVIISGDVVIFVHYDGHVTMKTVKCLKANERKLFNAIKKIGTEKCNPSCFSLKDSPMRVYLKVHKLNEEHLYDEQLYLDVWSDEDLEKLQNRIRNEPPPGMMTIDFHDIRLKNVK